MRWQITDANARRVLRFLPTLVYAPHIGAYFGSPTTGYTVVSMVFTPTRSPSFQVKFPDNNMGNGEWQTIEGWQLDAKNGIIDFGNQYVHRYNPEPPISGGVDGPNIENPEDVRFIYATPEDTVTARHPTNGFSGTAYSVAGLERTLHLYDEQLAVNYEYFNPETTAARKAQFKTLAERIHAQRSDIVYSGGCTLDGLQYEFQLLDRRINLAGVDENGDALTTGWENINAFLTDAEYDYEQGLTTLQFSSDHLELVGIDPEKEKEDLKVRALNPIYLHFIEVVAQKRRAFTEFGTPVIGADIGIRVDFTKAFQDPTTGEIQHLV